MSNRSASLQDVLSNHFNYETSQMYTAIPATVVSVDSLEEQRISVQPTINLRNDSLSIDVQRPPIVNVPLQMPITANGGISLPISSGDSVMLVFSMRALSTWKNSNGEFAPPPDLRRFDVKDCIAIPGVYPFKKSPNKRGGYSASDVMIVNGIGTDNESTISVSPSGGVEIDAPESISLNNGESNMALSGGGMELSTQDDINISSKEGGISLKPAPDKSIIFGGSGITMGVGAALAFAGGADLSESDGKMVVEDGASHTDSTSNRVLKVGDFGVGGAIKLTSTDDLNDITTPGDYVWSGVDTPINAPINGEDGGLRVREVSSSGVSQEYFGDSGSSIKLSRNTSDGSTWSDWAQEVNTENLDILITQSTGQSEDLVMSQKAVTDAIDNGGGGGGVVVEQTTGSSTTSVMSQKAVTDELDGKVDKVSGKGLSDNNYTISEKSKLTGIETGANKTTVVGGTGSSSTSVMSQNATTTALNNITNSLGTAASKTVTTSSTDSTSGRLLKVGDWGIGGNSIHLGAGVDNGDWLLDADKCTGIYYKGSATGGDFLSDLPNYSQIFWARGAALAGAFINVSLGGNIATGHYSGGVFQGVKTVHSTGSNANGTWIKLMDDTLICLMKSASSIVTGVAIGNIFNAAADHSFTFPAIFASAPFPVFSARWVNGRPFVGHSGALSTTGVNVRLLGYSSTSEGYIDAIAIGKAG